MPLLKKKKLCTCLECGVKRKAITLLDLDYAYDLSFLDRNVSKINKLLKAFRIWGARIGLKLYVKKSKSPRLEIDEGEGVMLRTIISIKLTNWVVLLINMGDAVKM